MGPVDKESKQKQKESPAKKKEPKKVDFTKHGILACGFDEVQSGWAMECICGFCTQSLPLMEMVGEEYDNHLRMVGILKDGTDV